MTYPVGAPESYNAIAAETLGAEIHLRTFRILLAANQWCFIYQDGEIDADADECVPALEEVVVESEDYTQEMSGYEEGAKFSRSEFGYKTPICP